MSLTDKEKTKAFQYGVKLLRASIDNLIDAGIEADDEELNASRKILEQEYNMLKNKLIKKQTDT